MVKRAWSLCIQHTIYAVKFLGTKTCLDDNCISRNKSLYGLAAMNTLYQEDMHITMFNNVKLDG